METERVEALIWIKLARPLPLPTECYRLLQTVGVVGLLVRASYRWLQFGVERWSSLSVVLDCLKSVELLHIRLLHIP